MIPVHPYHAPGQKTSFREAKYSICSTPGDSLRCHGDRTAMHSPYSQGNMPIPAPPNAKRAKFGGHAACRLESFSRRGSQYNVHFAAVLPPVVLLFIDDYHSML